MSNFHVLLEAASLARMSSGSLGFGSEKTATWPALPQSATGTCVGVGVGAEVDAEVVFYQDCATASYVCARLVVKNDEQSPSCDCRWWMSLLQTEETLQSSIGVMRSKLPPLLEPPLQRLVVLSGSEKSPRSLKSVSASEKIFVAKTGNGLT